MSNSFVTPWTEAGQAPLSMWFSRQEYWKGLSFPSPGDLPNPEIKARSSTWQVDISPLSHLGSHIYIYMYIFLKKQPFITYTKQTYHRKVNSTRTEPKTVSPCVKAKPAYHCYTFMASLTDLSQEEFAENPVYSRQRCRTQDTAGTSVQWGWDDDVR